MNDKMKGAFVVLMIVSLSVGFGLIINAFASWLTVDVGRACLIVHRDSGEISNPIVGAKSGFFISGMYRILGLQYPVWFDCTMTEENTIGMWGDGTDKYADYPAVLCFSKDQLEMSFDVNMRWELDVHKLKALYQNYPTKAYKDVVASIMREQIRIVTSTMFTAVETIENRNVVVQKMRDSILSKLHETISLEDAIINVEFEMRNIGYPANYTRAIELKLASEQEMMQAEFEKQRAIIIAQAEAEKVLIDAQARANATVVQAKSQSEAIDLLVSESGVSRVEIVKLFLWLNTLSGLERPTLIMTLGQDGVPIIVQLPQP